MEEKNRIWNKMKNEKDKENDPDCEMENITD